MRKGLAGAIAVSLLLGACSPIYRNHGYVPPESVLSQLTPGVDTRDSVIASVGQPTTSGVLGDRSLYYVQSRFRHFGLLPPEEVEREVLALSFLPNGTLGNIERFGLANGRVVQLTPRITSEVFADRASVNQIFGNLGRFDTGTFFGDD